ncbi:MAG: CerR family C-terminal domain-containing protein [Amaricoccus sp.]
MPNESTRSRSTRDVIVQAAMRGFAEKGFEATSIREIAALSGSNVAAISYHFGGKEGLRAACAEHIVGLLGGVLAAPGPGAPPPGDPAAAAALLATLARNLVRFLLLQPEARLAAGFILREMAQPSAALEAVYAGLFEPVHRRACALWAAATGREAEEEAVRLAVFAAIGQITYFHIARPIVERRMNWAGIGPAEAEAVADTVVRNIETRIAAERRAS